MQLNPPSVITKFSRWRSLTGTWRMARHPVSVFNHYLSRSAGHTYSFYFGGIKKAIVTADPRIIRHILHGNASNYHKSEIQVKRMAFFLGKGLLTLHGSEWLGRRRMIQKGFHKNRLDAAVALMHGDFEVSVTQRRIGTGSQPVDVYRYMMELTFRMVTNALFSLSLPPQELSFISTAIYKIQKFIVGQIVQPYLNPWRAVSGRLGKYIAMRNKADVILMRYIRQRRQSGEVKEDMLQLFLDAEDAETGKPLPDEEILHETMQLLVAGHETSSNALSWALYLLCRHPQVLSRLTTEVDTQLKGEPFAFHHLPELVYCRQVINETLRLYPPFWMVDRVAVKDDLVEGVPVKAGSTIIAFLYGTHHDTGLWPDPEQFRPERFAPGQQTPDNFFPFGAGPRGCIGGNFATVQMLLILTSILQQFTIQLVPDEPVDTAPLLILRPATGIHIRFIKRTPSVYL